MRIVAARELAAKSGMSLPDLGGGNFGIQTYSASAQAAKRRAFENQWRRLLGLPEEEEEEAAALHTGGSVLAGEDTWEHAYGHALEAQQQGVYASTGGQYGSAPPAAAPPRLAMISIRHSRLNGKSLLSGPGGFKPRVSKQRRSGKRRTLPIPQCLWGQPGCRPSVSTLAVR